MWPCLVTKALVNAMQLGPWGHGNEVLRTYRQHLWLMLNLKMVRIACEFYIAMVIDERSKNQQTSRIHFRHEGVEKILGKEHCFQEDVIILLPLMNYNPFNKRVHVSFVFYYLGFILKSSLSKLKRDRWIYKYNRQLTNSCLSLRKKKEKNQLSWAQIILLLLLEISQVSGSCQRR